MNKSKWDAKVDEERRRNKEKRAALVEAVATGAVVKPKPYKGPTKPKPKVEEPKAVTVELKDYADQILTTNTLSYQNYVEMYQQMLAKNQWQYTKSLYTSWYTTEDVPTELKKIIPGLRDFSTKCPECPTTTYLDRLIVHMNDDHQWSRERIADWLDTLPVDLTVRKESPCPSRPESSEAPAPKTDPLMGMWMSEYAKAVIAPLSSPLLTNS